LTYNDGIDIYLELLCGYFSRINQLLEGGKNEKEDYSFYSCVCNGVCPVRL
jgi:hypothetical protein